MQFDRIVTVVSAPSSVAWSIGGIGVRLASVDDGLEVALPRALFPFVGERGAPAALVSARWGRLAPDDRPATFDSGGTWTLRRGTNDLRFDFRSPRFGDLPYKTARFSEDFSTGEVVLHRPYFPAQRALYPLEYPLDELLFTNLAAARGGAELHGCGVNEGAEGFLFLGFSGAGKSTMARLWQDHSNAAVLSDDRIIVRVDGERPLMYGTPWHGDEAVIAAGPGPLTRIFFLEQAGRCAVRELSCPQAVAKLFTCCFAPFHDGRALGATLATLEALARRVPCAVLSFPRNAAIIDFIRTIG